MAIELDLNYRFQRLLEKSHQVPGILIARQLSYITDSVLISKFGEVRHILKGNEEVSLVATGGYGRTELAPYSDIDLLYLHNGVDESKLEKIISHINNYLYDSGKEVGHSCRTIKECGLYLDNMNSFHSMLDSRFLEGSISLYNKYVREFLEKLPRDAIENFFDIKYKALQNRFLSQSDPILLSEPNLKTDICGLRDIQYVYWMEKSKRNIPNLSGLGVLPVFQKGEVQEIIEAYEILTKIRISLHQIAGRKADRLDLPLQPEVAEHLEFGPRTEIQSIEKLMELLYRNQKNVFFFIRTYLDSLSHPGVSSFGSEFTYKTLHFVLEKNIVYPPRTGNLFTNPYTLYSDIMSVFKMLQEKDYQASGMLLNEIRFASHFLEDDFRDSADAIQVFLSILAEPKKRGEILTLMHECGVLGAALPEFGACTNFALFSYHHQYTVDEHTLLILRQLDLLDRHSFEDKQVQDVYGNCTDTDILCLVILLHDAGKVKEGDHSEYGAELAVSVGERLGLTEEKTDLLRFLVEYHTYMSELSSKRDIADPELLADFADLVESEDRLRLLYVLTIIDTKSVGQGVLTNWKKAILYSLFENTLQFLQSRPADYTKANQLQKLKSYLIQKEQLDEKSVSLVMEFAEKVEPASYLNSMSNRRILKHFRQFLLQLQNPTEPFFLEIERNPAYVQMDLVCQQDREILLDITCSISSEALNLVGVKIYYVDQMAVIAIQITDSEGSGNIPVTRLEDLEKKLGSLRTGKLSRGDIRFEEPIWSKKKPVMERIVQRSAEFNNDEFPQYTLLEVRMPDSVGLLYQLLRIILEANLVVAYMKVSTSADYAFDSFYIQTQDGKKLNDQKCMESIRSQILEWGTGGKSNTVQEILF